MSAQPVLFGWDGDIAYRSVVIPVRAHVRHVPARPVGTAPASHTHDPETSREAERAVTRSGVRGGQAAAVLDALRRVGHEYPGNAPTATELAARSFVPAWGEIGTARVTVARRLVDLRAAGHVTQGEARCCGVAGRSQVTWTAVPDPANGAR